MAIHFVCACGKRLRARDEAAGKRVRCPGCGNPVSVPLQEPEPKPEAYALGDEPVARPRLPKDPAWEKAEREEIERLEAQQRRDDPVPRGRYKEVPQNRSASTVQELFYWALPLTLIPLAFSLFLTEDDTESRFKRTLDKAPPAVKQRVERLMEDKDADEDDLIQALPNGRIEGAHLPRKALLHYVYALIAAAGFYALALVVFPTESARPVVLVCTGLFTGTVGILLLLFVQVLGTLAYGHVYISTNPILMLLFWVAFMIGFSYRAALDAEYGLITSLLGFTFGVGLCEEVCKALPLIWYYKVSDKIDWRDARMLGFLSGVGFGVAEAIMYSGDFYNGIGTVSIYVVRFVSCVALHAVWSASVALFIHRHQALLYGADNGLEYIPRVLVLVAVPMALHGLYDTFLKKDYNALALVTALVSFAWFVWLTEKTRGDEETEAPARRRKVRRA